MNSREEQKPSSLGGVLGEVVRNSGTRKSGDFIQQLKHAWFGEKKPSTFQRIINHLLLVIFSASIAVALTACKGTAGSGAGQQQSRKGVKQGMITYNIGRFSIDVPAEMKEAVRTHEFRYAEIEEFLWPRQADREKVRKEWWDRRIAEINQIPPPRGKEKTIIEQRAIPGIGTSATAVFYYRSDTADDEGFWDLLVDYGDVGVWFRFRGLLEAKEQMLSWLAEIARSYMVRPDSNMVFNKYSVRYGIIGLPYLEQESSYARFEGHPLGMTLTIKMKETHNVEEIGLIDRTVAALETGFAPAVKVKKIRSRKRVVAGLEGEEEVLQGTDGKKKMLGFDWEYRGKEDSGEYPEIQIYIDCKDGSLEEKLKIWDAILESMKPIGR